MSSTPALATRPATEWIGHRIFLIRKRKVMLSAHLAGLYGVQPKVLVQAVKRNFERFPEDFMFQLSPDEWDGLNLKSQIVTSSSESPTNRHGGMRRALPYAFTEQGVAMLSSVLKSPLAIQVNISIMRTFVRLRGEFEAQEEFASRLAALERQYEQHDTEIQSVFDSIREMMALPEKPARPMGFPAGP
jgi:hypothetical protein